MKVITMKHIETRFRFICDHYEHNDISVDHIPSANQLADVFTKPLGTMKFVRFREGLGVHG